MTRYSKARFRPRLFAFALVLGTSSLTHATAARDIFDQLTGTYGAPGVQGMACSDNPHRVTFSADRAASVFRWSKEITDYAGEPRLEGRYVVHTSDGTSITMEIVGEQRRTRDGRPVVWIMHRVTDPDGYCWGRTDWPQDRCESLHLRCTGDLPVS
jgi:hypothetical protein